MAEPQRHRAARKTEERGYQDNRPDARLLQETEGLQGDQVADVQAAPCRVYTKVCTERPAGMLAQPRLTQEGLQVPARRVCQQAAGLQEA